MFNQKESPYRDTDRHEKRSPHKLLLFALPWETIQQLLTMKPLPVY
jgi:hypothetical protein